MQAFSFTKKYQMRPAAARMMLGLFMLATICVAVGTARAQSQAPSQAPSRADPGSATAPRKAPGVQATNGTAANATATNAMVATANDHATRAGLEIMRAGGNAVDAAAAAQFVLNVVEPQSSGIGGGGFMLIYLAQPGRVVAIDGREEAPAAASPGMFLEPSGKPQKFYPDRITGGNAVGVPGLVMALEKAVKRYGSLSLAQVLAPAIRIAENGFTVSKRLASSLTKNKQRLKQFIATRKLFFVGRDKTLEEGSLFVQPELAASLKLLAQRGSEVFYRGEMAKDIVKAVRQARVNPGRMTLADLAAYDAPLRKPTKAFYRGYTLYGMGPPSSGGVTTFQILQLLQAAPPSKRAGAADDGSADDTVKQQAERLHRFVQAVRLAYADRERYLADPDFFDVPLAGLLSPAYARKRAKGMGGHRRLRPAKAGLPAGVASIPGKDSSREHASTTHISVVDSSRNMVALTSSIEQAFGSGMVVPGRGFLLNNQLTDFSAKLIDRKGRLIANRAEGDKRPRRSALERPEAPGGKRPRSSMAPTLVLYKGKPLLTIGSPGGGRIIQYVARVLLDVLDGRKDLQAAISAPHFTHYAGITTLEPGLAGRKMRARLARLGHRVRSAKQNSGLHGIWVDPNSGMLHGGVDPRREGSARGY